MSKVKKAKNEPSNKKVEGEEKDIYFMILYPRKQQEKDNEFVFAEKGIIPKNIYKDEIQQENEYFYKKVFKFNGKTKKKYSIEFDIDKDNYIIFFEVKENSFVYDVELKKGNKILKNIVKTDIPQNIIDYYEKLDIFLDALKKNKEENKTEENLNTLNKTLYEDTIELYKNKKGFSFLISLFVKIYKDKELCTSLISIFKEMNNKAKDNEKNLDRNVELKQYIDKFKEIYSEADDLITKKGYDNIEFYSIILCYFNYYAPQTKEPEIKAPQKKEFATKDEVDSSSNKESNKEINFLTIFKKLLEGDSKDLYEILLIYNSHFLNPINQDLNFFIDFIDYCVKNKDFQTFEKGLNYVTDIETFVRVINKTKEDIVKAYININKSPFKTIELKDNLKLKKNEKGEEIDFIIGEIKSINNYYGVPKNTSSKDTSSKDTSSNDTSSKDTSSKDTSSKDTSSNGTSPSKEKKKLLVHFTSNFWIKILKDYNIPNGKNIENCFKLRETFIEYKDIVNVLDEKSEIKNDINIYFERDEFAFILDNNIKKLLEKD